MTPETRRRARSILAAALDAPPGERPGLIAARCGDDGVLRSEVEWLLLDLQNPRPQASTVTRSLGEGASAEPPAIAVTGMGRPEPLEKQDAVASGDIARDAWGDFVLLHELGRGGFGVVHRAWDRTLKRDVALKIINVGRLPSSRRDLLVREGQMLARIRHPNVVVVYGVQRRGVEVGLAMEYIRGRTLADILGHDGPLSAEEAATVGVTLCDALAEVHRTGLVHRDVKSANVMREQGGRIVLMDFGAGHELAPEGDPASMIAGTPVYMSPEVLEGKVATPASDIYSLGVLLFHLVTGEFPVPEGPFDHLRAAHRSGKRQSLAALRPDLPMAFVDVIERAMAPSRVSRPLSATALRADLARLRNGKRAGNHSAPRKVLPATAKGRRRTVSAQLLMGVRVAAGVLVVCGVAGFVTTLEYNYVLARSEEFTGESWLASPYWGARVLLPTLFYSAAIFLAVNTVAFIGGLVALGVPPLASAWRRFAAAVNDRTRHAGRNGPLSWCQAVCVTAAFALCTILAVFAPLLAGLAENISTGDSAALATLTEAYRPAHQLFRFALTVLLLALLHGLLRVRRSVGLDGGGAASVQMGALLALLGAILLMLAVPWRVVREPEFREATWNGALCFVVGAHDTDVLVHCPALPVPRNRVVSTRDPRLVLHDRKSDLFAAYAAREAPASTSTE